MTPKPILIHGHGRGPNPWKVVLILEELGVPYEVQNWDFSEIKTPKFEKLNPNGRLPAIEDPNTGIILWESGAIVEYIVETYDKDHKFTYTSTPEKYQLKQWLHFQMSGQGPYFGQAFWWHHYYPEVFQPARDRYVNEVIRVASVIEKHLTATGSEYLVGDKYTYADLSFIPWFDIAFGQGWLKEDDTAFGKWYKRIRQRPVSVEAMTKRVSS